MAAIPSGFFKSTAQNTLPLSQEVSQENDLIHILWEKKGSLAEATSISPTKGTSIAHRTIEVRQIDEVRCIVLCPGFSFCLKCETKFLRGKTLQAKNVTNKNMVFSIRLDTFLSTNNGRFKAPEKKKEGSYRFSLVSKTGESWVSTNIFQFEDFFNDQIVKVVKTRTLPMIDRFKFDKFMSVECDFVNPNDPSDCKKMMISSSLGALWIKNEKILLDPSKELSVVIKDISKKQSKDVLIIFKVARDMSIINVPEPMSPIDSNGSFVFEVKIPLLKNDAQLLCIQIDNTIYETIIYLHNPDIVSDTRDANLQASSAKKLKVDFPSIFENKLSEQTTLPSTYKEDTETVFPTCETTKSQVDATPAETAFVAKQPAQPERLSIRFLLNHSAETENDTDEGSHSE